MKFPTLVLLALLLFSCKSDEKRMIDDIHKLEANKSLATSDTLINSYINFANKYPKHEYAVRMLYKAARANSKAHRSEKAFQLYKRIADEYKDTCCTPWALMAEGVYLQQKGDIDEAKKVYTRFMRDYPDHPLRSSAELNYQYMGLSEAEQMDRFWKSVEQQKKLDSLRKLKEMH